MGGERIVPEDVHEEFACELFHENSKQRRSDARFIERILAANFDPAFRRIMGPTHKVYPGAQRIALPVRFPKAKRNFDDAVTTRRSRRAFSGGALSLAEAAKLLHYSSGVTGRLDADDGFVQLLRAAPSGGALYPVETYALVQRVTRLKSGIYHFNPVENCLEAVSPGNPFPELIRITFVEELRGAALVLVLTGVSMKNRIKYGERGYRFMLLEAGHIAQNFLLSANAMGLDAFTIGGFVDDELDELLRIEDFDETSLYLMAVGRRARR